MTEAHGGPAGSERLPAEELPLGREVDCGSHEVAEAEIIDFAATWDPQYFHTDPVAAADSDFGGLIASGLHTLSIYQRLAITAVFRHYDVIAGRELERVRFLRPVRPGDVLSCTIVIESVEPRGAGRCRVVNTGTLRDQEGRAVLEVRVDSLVRSRG